LKIEDGAKPELALEVDELPAGGNRSEGSDVETGTDEAPPEDADGGAEHDIDPHYTAEAEIEPPDEAATAELTTLSGTVKSRISSSSSRLFGDEARAESVDA
jgi:hypothetical protein